MISLWIAQTSAVVPSSSEGWLTDPEILDPGYAEVMADGTIQTSFPPPPPIPEASQMPGWLSSFFNAIGDLFRLTGGAAKPLLWILAGALILFLLYHLVPAFADWVDQHVLRRKPKLVDGEAEDVGEIEAGRARALLADADALAAEGRYAEAIHLLLYRSVDDISDRRPGLVKPAMTSRALSAAGDLPAIARDAFSRIARAVEISLFGGRPIDADAWHACRNAYSELTIPKNWARA